MTFKVRDKRNKDWFYIDNEYLNGLGKHLGPIGIAIYVSLCRHAHNETQECFPSQAKISEEINVSVKTVKKYLGLLKEHNVISVQQKRSPNGKFLHNLYILMDKEVWIYPQGTKVPTDRGELGSTTVGNVVPTNNTNNNYTNLVNSIIASEPTTDLQTDAVNPIIELFREVNPSYKKIFSNKTQRSCLQRLIDEHGLEEIRKIVMILPRTNEEPYFPIITTPYQLEQKLGNLLSSIQRASKEKEKNNIIKL